MESRREIFLKQLEVVADECGQTDKYAIIWDKTGSCMSFFSYRANIVHFDKEVLKVRSGAKTPLEACEAIRKGAVGTMSSGRRLVISVNEECPDFNNDYTSGEDKTIFPASDIFNFQPFTEYANYIKIVKIEEMDENFTSLGFGMYILAKYINEEECDKLVANIPHSEHMLQYIVKNEEGAKIEVDLKAMVEKAAESEQDGDDLEVLLKYCQKKNINKWQEFLNAIQNDLLSQGLGDYNLLDTDGFKKIVELAWERLTKKMGGKPGDDLGAGADKNAFEQAMFMIECEPKHAKEAPINKWKGIGPLNFEENVTKFPNFKDHSYVADFQTTIGYVMGRPGIYSGLLNKKKEADGIGRFVSKDKIFSGSIFECQFKKGEVEGYARMIWSDGSYRIGTFKDNDWVQYDAFNPEDKMYEQLVKGKKTKFEV